MIGPRRTIPLNLVISEFRAGGEISRMVADALEKGVSVADILEILRAYDPDDPPQAGT